MVEKFQKSNKKNTEETVEDKRKAIYEIINSTHELMFIGVQKKISNFIFFFFLVGKICFYSFKLNNTLIIK